MKLLLVFNTLLVLGAILGNHVVLGNYDVSVDASASLTSVPLDIWTDRLSTYALRDAATAYQLVDPIVNITLTDGDMLQNPQALVESRADVVALSSSLAAQYSANFPNLYMVPLLAEAIVPIYRLDSIGTNVPLVLSRTALAGIYNGDITQWNHPAIQQTNPSLTMPALAINIIIDAQPGDIHLIYLTAMSKMISNFSIPVTTDPSYDWPLGRYSVFNWFQGVFGVCGGVANYDGSISMAAHSLALIMKNNIASLINKAGATVTANTNSVTFAAVELGTSLTLQSRSAVDLTDCTSSSCWPISTFTYILLDSMNSRGTCKSRAAMVQFFLNFYQSSTITSLLKVRGYARVPDIVMEQMEILSLFETSIQCRGDTALPTTIAITRTMAVPSQLAFLSNLLTSTYEDPDPTPVQWQLDVNTDSINILRLANKEVDLAFFNPENVDKELLEALEEDGSYHLLPTFAFSWSWTYHPQLTYTQVMNQPLVLDGTALSLLVYSCIRDWNDPHLLALNPWLGDILQNQSVPLILFSPCAGSAGSQPGTDFVRAVGIQLSYIPEISQCIQNYSLWDSYNTCVDQPSYNLRYVRDESVIPPRVVGTWASMGVMMGNSDPNFASVTFRMPNPDGTLTDVKGDIPGMLACASDTFDPATQKFNFDASADPTCYPGTQQFFVAFRKKYSSTASTSESCNRGIDALQFLSFLYSNDQVDGIVESQNIALLATHPFVENVFNSVLNGVLCDDTTLLITLPQIWQLSEGLQTFGYFATALGEAMAIGLIIFVIIFHQHPVIRAASPLFMLQSLTGVLMLFAGAAALMASVSTGSCNALSWLVNLGLMVTFAPLFAKTWRIYRIFGRKKLSVVKISNRKLMLLTVVLLISEIVLMSVWQSISPIQPYVLQTTEGNPPREYHYTQCGVKDEGGIFFAVAGIEKGLLLVFGALMAFSTRRVSSQFNESSQVALAIYNVVFSIGIIAPIIVVIDAKGDVLVALLLFVLLWIAFFTALVLVVPQAMHIYNKAQTADTENASVMGSSKSGNSAFSFLSLDVLGTVMVTKTYLLALRKHVEKVETHYQAQKKQIAGTAAVTGKIPTTVTSRNNLRSPPPESMLQRRQIASSSVVSNSDVDRCSPIPAADMRYSQTCRD